MLFRYRGYTPMPFLAIMVWFAEPTVLSLIAGLLITVLGEALRLWGVAVLGGEARATAAMGSTLLVTTGPFAYVRNPLYIGNMLLYTGIGVMSLALFPWLLVAALCWFSIQYALIISLEEEFLRERFGKDYEAYQRRVRRFIPRLRPGNASHALPRGITAREPLGFERRTLQAIGAVVAMLVAIFVVRG